jgi:hypothetical protein
VSLVRGQGERDRHRSRDEELILDTGDNLHFGLARLMAHSAGNSNVELVVVGDDVSVPHSRGKMVGRRCLAGITLGTSFPRALFLPFAPQVSPSPAPNLQSLYRRCRSRFIADLKLGLGRG